MLPPAAAFDAIAERFDARYGAWASVAAQRRPVRAALARAFPRGARVLEIGGGTGEDASWLIERGRDVLLTDPSPTMVRLAAAKLAPSGAAEPVVCAAESLDALAPYGPFDGAFSNFAGLNCVTDLRPVGAALAQLVRPGGRVLLVIFGTAPIGEWVVQLVRRDVKAAVRRFSHGDVPARLGGQHFTVRYHRRADVVGAMAPWFTLVRRIGVGVFVPPSAAEPWITGHPKLLGALESLDRIVARPLAGLGDHVLYEFVRS